MSAFEELADLEDEVDRSMDSWLAWQPRGKIGGTSPRSSAWLAWQPRGKIGGTFPSQQWHVRLAGAAADPRALGAWWSA